MRFVDYSYDKFLRNNSLVSKDDSEIADNVLNILMVRDFFGNVLSKEGNSYSYDGMKRLAIAEGNKFTYDQLSNLRTIGFNKTYEYEVAGAGNQMRLKKYTEIGDTSEYTYDSNGNITKVTGKFDYGSAPIVYDDQNRLREITYNTGPSTQKTERYFYDQTGLRFKKVDGDGKIYYTIYSGDDILYQEKYSSDGTTLEESVFNVLF